AGDLGVGADGTTNPGQLSGDIRYVIHEANQPANRGSTINFRSIPNGRVILSHGELQIQQDMTIVGVGSGSLDITSLGTSRIFHITPPNATVLISAMTISDGNASPNNSAVPGNQGGNIFNSGNLTLVDDLVTNGLAEGGAPGMGLPQGSGGGIYNAFNA